VNGPAQNTSVWKIRRFKVYMGGYAFSRDLTYRVQVDLAKSGTAQMLDDAWINYRFLDEAQLQAGQFKMPFSRGELTSDGALQFVDRANAVDAFKPSYDIGAMVQGKTAGGKLAYNAGLFNGTGQSGTRTTNSGPGRRASFSTPSARCGTARRTWKTRRAPSSPSAPATSRTR